MTLQVTLATSPPQVLQGFTSTAPVAAHSSPSHPSTPGASTGSLPGVSKWLGIPFGTAERFSISTPYVAEPGAGVRECFEFGPTPLQPLGAMEPFWLKKEGWMDRDFVGEGEDCLSLNVFAPAKAREELKSLPVMVWLYGGALNTGHSAAVRHDATELVRQSEKDGHPCIVVTGNYRVNIFGFLSHPDLSAASPDGLSGNYGFHDQLLLLNWVQQHIALFKGDPAKVTVFGESAGAFSIAILAARRLAPSSPSLFQRAILQSGFPSTMAFRPPGYSLWDQLLEAFSLSSLPTAAERVRGLRAVPASELLDFIKSRSSIGGWGGTIEKGGLWEVQPEARYQAGDYDRSITSWVLGCNEHEGTLFAKILPGAIGTPQGFASYLARQPEATAAKLRALYPEPTPAPHDLVNTPGSILLADQLFLGPMHSLAISLRQSSSPPMVRVYEFQEELPQMSGDLGIGIHHAIEIPSVASPPR
ncbi:hypothetical protein RQP46_011096 [Phenoliferia psychrophenolica]